MLLNALHLKNILSFKDTKLELQPLNVLIGPNGSGKSNLIDIVALLQAVPYDLTGFLRRNGPTGGWVWNGSGHSETPFQLAEVEADFGPPGLPLSYDLQIIVQDDRVHSLTERLDLVETEQNRKVYVRPFFQASNENARLWPTRADGTLADYGDQPVQVDVPHGKSVFSEIRNPADYPALTQTARLLSATKTYRSWQIGRDSLARRAQATDGAVEFLEEDFSNLALVVNDLRDNHGLGPMLDGYLERFYESYKSLHTPVYGNTIRLTVREIGLSKPVPATRLSDGTIRFIALLAILCHPEPPPLICIEEPEVGLHPDSIDLVVTLLRAASERTQIIVTTHSPWLIDRLSATPEQVVVVDQRPGEGTQFKRYTRQDLEDWLEDQPLGETWMAGAIGGVR